MSPARFAVAFVLFSSLIVSSAAQQVATTSTMQAVQLLQRSLAALTGSAPLNDITLSGTARRIAGSDDESGTATLKALATGESRLDLSLPSGNRTEIRASSAGIPVGSWSGPDAKSHPISYHNLLTDQALLPAFTLTKFLADPRVVVTFVREETKNDHTVFHLAAYLSQLPQSSADSQDFARRLTQIEILIDTATLLPVAIDFNTHPDDNAGLDIPIEVLFSNYQPTAGAQVPLRVQKFLNNGLILDLQFESATVNSGLPAGQFAVQAQ